MRVYLIVYHVLGNADFQIDVGSRENYFFDSCNIQSVTAKWNEYDNE